VLIYFLKGHSFQLLSCLPAFRTGFRKDGTPIQAVERCRICKKSTSYYCIQCTFIHHSGIVFACHPDTEVHFDKGCAGEHCDNPLLYMNRYYPGEKVLESDKAKKEIAKINSAIAKANAKVDGVSEMDSEV
jgi:hypothetical protein